MVGSTSSFSSTRKRRRSGQSDASSSIVSEDATNPMAGGLPIDLISPASSNVSSKKKARNVVNTPGNLQSLILNIFENVRVLTNEHGKLLCESLMRMPTRRSNPDYYEVVKEPIDFTMIQKNVKSAKYQTMEQFVHDVNLMVENEKLYHRRSSQEHKDACEFWNLFLSVKKEAEILESVTRASEVNEANVKAEPSGSGVPQMAKSVSAPAPGTPSSQFAQNVTPDEARTIIANVLYNLLSVHEDDRYIAEIFKRVPSATSYPIYYDVIKNPIDMWMIFKKLKGFQYESLNQFEEDVTLLINNAKTFNEPGSQVFKDALTMKKLASSLIYKFQIEKAPADNSLMQKIEAYFEEYLTSSDSESAEDESEFNTSNELSQSQAGVREQDGASTSRVSAAISNAQKMARLLKKSSDEDSMEDVDDEDRNMGVSPYWSLWKAVIYPLNKDGSRICKQFKVLPNKKQYPDYYQEIKHPMCLTRIKSKIKKCRYRDLNQCYDDFNLMFQNCMKYNMVDSQIYRDAEYLLELVTAKKTEIDVKGFEYDDYSLSRKKPGRKPGTKIIPLGPDGTPCPELKPDMDLLRKRLRAYYNLIAKHTEPDGRETAEMFMQLPCREAYPFYYEYITNPMDLKMIDRKIRSNEYYSEDEFMADVHLMFENARMFNEEGSQIYSDAIKLENLVKEKKASFAPLGSTKRGRKKTATKEKVKLEATAEQADNQVKKISNANSSDSNTDNQITTKKRINFGMASIRPNMVPGSSSGTPGMMNDSFNSSVSIHAVGGDMSRQPLSPISSGNIGCPTLVLPSPSMFNQNSNASNGSSSNAFGTSNPASFSQSHFETSSPAATPCAQASSQSAPSTTVDQIAFSNPMQRKLFTLYEAVKMKRAPRSGRELFEPFYRLPTRTDLPGYYKVIAKPIDMQKIYQKMSSNGYEDLNELVDDFVLMFNNACKFNEPGSRIYKDAILLMRALIEKKNELMSSGCTSSDSYKVPNIPEIVNDLLQRVFIFTVNKDDEDGRCYSDSVYPIIYDRHAENLPPLSLEIIARNLDGLVYKRLDHLQDDLFALLHYVREISMPDSEAFEDSLEMQLFFTRKRDEMTKGGEVLFSPALHVTGRQIEKETEEQRKKHPKPAPPINYNYIDISRQAVGYPLAFDVNDLQQPAIIPGRFVYIKESLPPAQAFQDPNQPHGVNQSIKEILFIKQVQEDAVVGERFLFPRQVATFPGRKFMAKEVLQCACDGGYSNIVTVPKSLITGPQCHVMHIKDFMRFNVAKLDEKDVYICESQFRMFQPPMPMQNNFDTVGVGRICKIKSWSIETHSTIGLVKREYRINRVDRRAIVERIPEDQNLMPDKSLYNQRLSCLEATQANSSENSMNDNCIYYEQYVLGDKVFRLGDGVILPLPKSDSELETTGAQNESYLKSEQMDTSSITIPSEDSNATETRNPGASDIDHEVDEYVKSKLMSKDKEDDSENLKPKKMMRRIEKLWRDTDGVVWFSGSWYLTPCQVEHEPTKMFFKNELLVSEPQLESSIAEMAVPTRLDLAEKTFTVMIVREYTNCRPTEYNEDDVYVCDNRYYPDEKMISKLKKGLRMPMVSKKIQLDEIYYFKKPLTIAKEPSPFLFVEKIDMEDHGLDASGADSLGPGAFGADMTGDDEIPPTGTPSGAQTQSSRRGAASKNVPMQKKASGYIAFASVMRPKLKELKPDLEFGELSKEVGNKWNELSKEEKDLWDRKAEEKASLQTPRAAEPCLGYENSTPVVVYECCWEGCDFMFEDETDMFVHLIKDETTHINSALQENGQYKCAWVPCFKNKKQPKIFPNPNRLGRHLRESHFKYAARFIYPPQISRHFVGKGMLAHFQQNPPIQPVPNDSAGVVAPTWSQTEVVGGIIPTPLPFRSLTHDMNHMWNIVHIHNPCAEDMSALNNTSSHAVHPTGPVSAPNPNQTANPQYPSVPSQYNNSSSMPVGTSLPNQSSGLPQVSNVAPLPPNSSSVMGGDSQGMMTSSVPSGPHYQPQPIASRSQVSGMSHQMTQSPHSNNFASRPLTSKQPAQVMGANTGAPSSMNNQSNQTVAHSSHGSVYYVRDQHNHPVQTSGQAQRPQEQQSAVQPSSVPVAPQPHVPAHVPEVIPAPVSQTVQNPYRQGSFEANVFNHMSTGPGNPPPPPNVFTADGKPLFIAPPLKRTPLTHSKVYLDYIKNLPNKHVSDLKKTLAPMSERPHVNKQTVSAAASNFFKPGSGSTKIPSMTKALWALRDYMLKDSVAISNYHQVEDVDVDADTNSDLLSSGRELSVLDF